MRDSEIKHRFEAQRDLIDVLDREHKRLHAQMDKATKRARKHINYRLAQMNELREQIESERGTFMRRDAFDQFKDSMAERERNLMRIGMTLLIAAITVTVTVATYFR